jgi:hypothetical protein
VLCRTSPPRDGIHPEVSPGIATSVIQTRCVRADGDKVDCRSIPGNWRV